LLGAEVFGAIQGNQNLPFQPAEYVQAAFFLFKPRHKFKEHRVKQPRRSWVKHIADAIAAGDLAHAG
jgi:hypothetical protein